MLVSLSAAQIERFWSRVDRTSTQGCWEWTQLRDRDGYGVCAIRAGDVRIQRAHRAAYAIVHGALPDHLLVCHTCDNPPCCRPEHLFPGTHQTNVADRQAKNRQARGARLNFGPRGGELNANAKLTWDQVGEIRSRSARGEATRALARELHLTARTVRLIVRGETWRLLDYPGRGQVAATELLFPAGLVGGRR